jgi:hypothetical protein
MQLLILGKLSIFIEHLNIMTLLTVKKMYYVRNYINIIPSTDTHEHTLATCLDYKRWTSVLMANM